MSSAYWTIAICATALAGCAGTGIGSQLEAEAGFACLDAIERLSEGKLADGWKSRLQEDSGESTVKAWAPGNDPQSTPPDYTCIVVRDDSTPMRVRVVDVVTGR